MHPTFPCSESDLEILKDELKSIYRGYLAGGIFVLAVAFIMPWLGSSKTHGKAMVDYMPYPQAMLYILLVGGFLFIVSYLLSVPKLKSDVTNSFKSVYSTTISKKETYEYKKSKGRCVLLNEMPAGVRRIYLTQREFDSFKENDAVEVEYFPYSKKVIRVTPL